MGFFPTHQLADLTFYIIENTISLALRSKRTFAAGLALFITTQLVIPDRGPFALPNNWRNFITLQTDALDVYKCILPEDVTGIIPRVVSTMK